MIYQSCLTKISKKVMHRIHWLLFECLIKHVYDTCVFVYAIRYKFYNYKYQSMQFIHFYAFQTYDFIEFVVWNKGTIYKFSLSNVFMKTDNNKLSSISKINKAKYKFKVEQRGPLKILRWV